MGKTQAAFRNKVRYVLARYWVILLVFVSFTFMPAPPITWVGDSQFATIRKLNGFVRIRPGFAMLLDIVQIALLYCLACELIRNSH